MILNMKKKILIIITIIIIVALGTIGYIVFTDIKQEEKLMTELNEISDLVNSENINMDNVNQRLDRIVTTGDYAIVEDSFKSYLRENFDNTMQIAEILNDEKIVNILTAQNYKEDGKDFVNTKEYIKTTREKLESCKTKYVEFFTEEKAMSYINNKGLDSYYIDLYKEEFVGDIENTGDTKTVEDSINEIIEILNISEETINLLSENKNSWEIQGENIVFSNDSLSEKYDELINSL